MKKSLILIIVFLGVAVAVLNANNSAVTVFLNDGDVTVKSKSNPDIPAEVTEVWEFYLAVPEPTPLELEATGNYKFGNKTGCLYASFMDLYVVKEEVIPGDPTLRTVIKKPGIYNAVRLIEKQLTKELKNKELTHNQAATRFTNVLNVALAAIDSDSDSFEAALQNCKKDSSRLLTLFDRVKLKNIY